MSEPSPFASAAVRPPAAIAVAALALLLGLPALPVPPGRDQGIFLYHGDRILAGGIPYRDMWDHKPPGIHYVYAAALALGGGRPEAVNALDLAARTTAAVVLLALVGRVSGAAAGFLTAVAFVAWTSTYAAAFWMNAQPEGFLLLPLALACLLWLRPGRGSALAAGALLGLAALLKPTAALFLPALALAGPGGTPGGGASSRRRALPLAAGFAAPPLASLAAFALAGAGRDLWDAVVAFNAVHAGRPMPWVWLWRQLAMLFPWAAPPVLAALVSPRVRASLAWPGGLLLAAFAGLAVQRKFFGYHYHPLILPAAWLAGIGLAESWRALREASRPLVRAGGLVVWLAATGLASTAAWRDWYVPYVREQRGLERLAGRLGGEQYAGRFARADVYLAHSRSLAAWLAERTRAEETILVWGFEPAVNFWAGRAAPTRFEFDLPLVFVPADAAAARLRERYRAIFLTEIAARPPAWVVVARHDENHLEDEDSAAQLAGFPAFAGLLARDYRLEGTIGDFELYRRLTRSPAGASAPGSD